MSKSALPPVKSAARAPAAQPFFIDSPLDISFRARHTEKLQFGRQLGNPAARDLDGAAHLEIRWQCREPHAVLHVQSRWSGRVDPGPPSSSWQRAPRDPDLQTSGQTLQTHAATQRQHGGYDEVVRQADPQGSPRRSGGRAHRHHRWLQHGIALLGGDRRRARVGGASERPPRDPAPRDGLGYRRPRPSVTSGAAGRSANRASRSRYSVLYAHDGMLVPSGSRIPTQHCRIRSVSNVSSSMWAWM